MGSRLNDLVNNDISLDYNITHKSSETIRILSRRHTAEFIIMVFDFLVEVL